MPNPKPNETEQEYVSRFMGSKEAQKSFPDAKQRAKVAYSKYREHKKGKKMTNNMNLLTFNLGGKIRYEMLEGRRHIVAPIAMICPGVLNGSRGPLYYPEEELKKEPHVWNHVPIVLYHPTRDGRPISARDPDVINSRKLGIILNTHYDNKLRAEAWLDEERTKRIDNRIIDALENMKVMEVSTGVFSDDDETPGEYNGIKFNATTSNYRADHLALLPDQIGACSVKDGAGLLQVNSSDVGAIASAIANQVKSLLKESSVDKKKIVDGLIANGGWAETDREWLESLNDDQLTKMSKAPQPEKTENQGKEKGPDDEEEEATAKKKKGGAMYKGNKKKEAVTDNEEEAPKEVSVDEFINNAPAGIQGMLREGLKSHLAEKDKLVKEILANKSNTFKEETLNAKDLEELKAIASLARFGNQNTPAANAARQGFYGAATGDPNVNQRKTEPLPLPSMSFTK